MTLYDEMMEFIENNKSFSKEFKLMSLIVHSLVPLHEFPKLKQNRYKSDNIKSMLDRLDSHDIPIIFEFEFRNMFDDDIYGNEKRYFIIETRYKYNKRVLTIPECWKELKYLTQAEKKKFQAYKLLNLI